MKETSENTNRFFDPQKVVELIRAEYARGHQPANLVLGRREVESYRQLLSRPHSASMLEHYFHGLEIVEDSATTKMALVGDKGAWEG